jgi:hypothetical protein
MLHFCNTGMNVSISSWYKSGSCIRSHSWIASSSSLLWYLQPHKCCFHSQNQLLHACCINMHLWFAGPTGAVIVVIIIIFVFIYPLSNALYRILTCCTLLVSSAFTSYNWQWITVWETCLPSKTLHHSTVCLAGSGSWCCWHCTSSYSLNSMWLTLAPCLAYLPPTKNPTKECNARLTQRFLVYGPLLIQHAWYYVINSWEILDPFLC